MNARHFTAIFFISILFLLIATSVHPAQAQATVTQEELIEFENHLNEADQVLLQTLESKNPRDYRYDYLLDKIAARFNAAGSLVYPNYEEKEVAYMVFAGAIGYNACAAHKTIVIDSLYIDAMKRYAEGIAYYGKAKTDYTRKLANAVGNKDIEIKEGKINIDYENEENPFSLPLAGTLSAEEQQNADRIFEGMIAWTLSHETAHAFKEHKKRVLLTFYNIYMKYRNQGYSEEQLTSQISKYIKSTHSRKQEYEADYYGVSLYKKAGYDKKCITYAYYFSQVLFEAFGVNEFSEDASHPASVAREKRINKIWNQI